MSLATMSPPSRGMSPSSNTSFAKVILALSTSALISNGYSYSSLRPKRRAYKDPGIKVVFPPTKKTECFSNQPSLCLEKGSLYSTLESSPLNFPSYLTCKYDSIVNCELKETYAPKKNCSSKKETSSAKDTSIMTIFKKNSSLPIK